LHNSIHLLQLRQRRIGIDLARNGSGDETKIKNCGGAPLFALVAAVPDAEKEVRENKIEGETAIAKAGSPTPQNTSPLSILASPSPTTPIASELPAVSKSSTSATTPISSSWEEIGRALELLGITWNEWLSPLGQGLLPPDNRNPSSWDEFWELSLKTPGWNSDNSDSDDILVAEQFTRYLERLGPTYVKFGCV
jgi:hypothetical protein